jgi:drug/metabolite transporter (DMT)-like permease
MSSAPIPRAAFFLLGLLSLGWGFNWPIMKVVITEIPRWIFRGDSILLASVGLFGVAWLSGQSLKVPAGRWPQLLAMASCNIVGWNMFAIYGVSLLPSGRAAILGYTMPVFAALWAVVLYGERPGLRQALSVGAATLGVALLLTHEVGRLAGSPGAVAMALGAAAVWAFGTHELRRAKLAVPLLTVVFWMTTLAAVLMAALAWIFEGARWQFPAPHVQAAIAYNALAVFGFAHAAWFFLARTMPPLASSVSVMMIPVLGTFSGAWWLGEALHWQDYAAMVLMVAAIGTALLRRTTQA